MGVIFSWFGRHSEERADPEGSSEKHLYKNTRESSVDREDIPVTQPSRNQRISHEDEDSDEGDTSMPSYDSQGVPADDTAEPEYRMYNQQNDEGQYHVAIVCHDRYMKQAGTLKDRLQTLFHGQRNLRIGLSSEIGSAGKTEIANLDTLVQNVHCILLLIEDDFLSDRQCMFVSNTAIFSSQLSSLVDKYDYVIPVFTKEKSKIATMKPTIKSIQGINYYNEVWTDDVKEVFRREIERCVYRD